MDGLPGLQLCAQKRVQLLTAPTACGQPDSVFQYYHSLAFEQWLKFLNTVEIDYGRSMDSEELLGRETFFDLTNASAQEVT